MEKIKAIADPLIHREPLPLLIPKEVWNPALSQQIHALTADTIGMNSADKPSAQSLKALQSLLLLWNDDLDASHTISQSMDTPLGSYLHGIMHRREGDFSNAKYWFSLAGQLPIHRKLYEEGSQIDADLKNRGAWDPKKMVDEVRAIYEKDQEDSVKGIALRNLQILEFNMLLGYSLTIE